MYRYLRNTHLFLGLFCCLFLLMYGISAVQMSHNRWFNLKPAVIRTKLALPRHLDDGRAVARLLMRDYGVRGELNQVRAGAARTDLRIERPGTVYEIEYLAESGEAEVRENRAGFMGMLNRIHHAAGLWHEFPLTNAWGAFTGIVSAALFAIGLTGVYLWFKMPRERIAGTILLAGGLALGISLIFLLRAAA